MFSKFFKKKEVMEAVEKVPQWTHFLRLLSDASDMPPNFYPAPQLPSSVAPDTHDTMAMDGFCTASNYAGLDAQFYSSYLGYPALAQLAQSTEYRLVAETFSQEITREWGEVKGSNVEKIEVIEKELKRYGIRNLIRKQVENDFLYGGSQMYIDIKGQEEKTELPLLINEKGIAKGSLNGFSVREPMWSTPSAYNAHNALLPDYFVPETWWVLGKNVHHTRLMTLTMRPVPDMLKPAYNFYGIAMSQLMLPYVQRLQSTLDATAKVITMFSLTGIKTDMTAVLSGNKGGANQLMTRLKALTMGRDNKGVVALNKDTEEFFQINTPLNSLDALLNIMIQAVAYPSKIPVLKLFGTPTAGLGNTDDGEIRVFYDAVSSLQESYLLPHIEKIIKCIQLSKFGEIDEDIEFRFNPLYQMDDNERADVNLKKAQTAQILIQEGIIDNDEARQALNDDEDSGYQVEGKAPEPDPYDIPDETIVDER